MNKLEELHLDELYKHEYEEIPNSALYKFNYEEASVKSAEITEQIAIEFAEWKDYNFYQHIEDNLYRTMQARPMYKLLENKSYTIKQLFQEFLKQRQ